MVRPSFSKHPGKFRAIHCRHEVLEGSAVGEIIILEFLTCEDATLWYRNPEYQAAGELRFQSGDCRYIIPEGLPTGSPIAPPIARLGTGLEPSALERRHSGIHSKRQPTRYPATTDYFPATRRYCRPTLAVAYA